MSDNTKSNTIKGLFWNALDRFGNQIVVTLVTIITSRVLDIEDFGVIGVLSIFLVITKEFVDSGLGTSLVRSKHVSEMDYSSMFAFNLVVSTVLYLTLFFAAPYIQEYYGIANLALYTRVLFIQLLIDAFGKVQYVKILRNFQFNINAKVNVLSIFLSGVIVVALALLGFGIWALLLQSVLNSCFRTFFLWSWGNWKLRFQFSWDSLRGHSSFSLFFMAASLLGKIVTPMYYSFIGKHFSKEETGYYYQGNKWGETSGMLINSIIQGTTLSTLTPIQDDFHRFLNACRKTLSTLGFILFPANMLAIVVSEPAFNLVLTDKWLPSVIYFQLLCIAGYFVSFNDMNVNFLNIKGKSKYALILEIVKFSLAFLVLLLTYSKGVLYIIYGQILVRAVVYFITATMSGKVYGYHLFSQFRDLMPSFLIAAFAALIAYLPFYFQVVSSDLLMIIMQSAIFLLIYVFLNHITRNVIWLEILIIAKRKLNK